MTGKIVTLAELVEILDVSPKAIRDLMISPSFPFHEKNRRGKAHLFDTAAVVNWLRERERKRAAQKPDAGDDPKSRTQRAAAEIKELELAEKRGDLFHLADWAPFVDDLMVRARDELTKAPIEFGEEYSKPPPIDVTVNWFTRKIIEILNRLSGGMKAAPAEVGLAGQSRRN
jgi:phage terminase Nu1 subunit (DNA packaging protein)